MNATAQTLLKQSDYPSRGGDCGREFSPVFALEHLDNLAYVRMRGNVYIGVSRRGYKVGFSTNPKSRAKEHKIELLAFAPGRMVDELGLHHLLADFRCDPYFREWYRKNQRVDCLIKAINEIGALPDEIVRLGDCYAASLLAKQQLKVAAQGARSVLASWKHK